MYELIHICLYIPLRVLTLCISLLYFIFEQEVFSRKATLERYGIVDG